MQQRLDRLSPEWPPGYRFQFGGEYEEQVKGFDSVALALVVSLAVIYLALVLQFNSVTKPLVVFAGVPFGMVGGMHGPAALRTRRSASWPFSAWPRWPA